MLSVENRIRTVTSGTTLCIGSRVPKSADAQVPYTLLSISSAYPFGRFNPPQIRNTIITVHDQLHIGMRNPWKEGADCTDLSFSTIRGHIRGNRYNQSWSNRVFAATQDFFWGQGLEGTPVLSALFKEERKGADCLSGNMLQEIWCAENFPRVPHGRGIEACGLGALGTGASKVLGSADLWFLSTFWSVLL